MGVSKLGRMWDTRRIVDGSRPGRSSKCCIADVLATASSCHERVVTAPCRVMQGLPRAAWRAPCLTEFPPVPFVHRPPATEAGRLRTLAVVATEHLRSRSFGFTRCPVSKRGPDRLNQREVTCVDRFLFRSQQPHSDLGEFCLGMKSGSSQKTRADRQKFALAPHNFFVFRPVLVLGWHISLPDTYQDVRLPSCFHAWAPLELAPFFSTGRVTAVVRAGRIRKKKNCTGSGNHCLRLCQRQKRNRNCFEKLRYI